MNGGNASRFQHLLEGSELEVQNESWCDGAGGKSARTPTRDSKLFQWHHRWNIPSEQTHRLAIHLKNQAVLRILGVPKGRPDGRENGKRPFSSEGIWNAPALRSSFCPRLQAQIISPVIRL